MKILSAGSKMLSDYRRKSGVLITYKRGSRESAPIAASVGESIYESDQVGLGIILARMVDFFIDSADLMIDDERIEPHPGDTIISDHTGVRLTYIVTPDGGDDAYIPHDNRNGSWRIHTKERDRTPNGDTSARRTGCA